MPFPEEIAPVLVQAEAPWGATTLVWQSIDQLELDYTHVHDITLGTEDEPLSVAYGVSRFSVRLTDLVDGDVGEIEVTHCHTEWYRPTKRPKTEWSLAAETDESCRREIVSWVRKWIEQNRTTYKRAVATLAHNEIVRLRYRARDDQRGPCDGLRIRRALQRVLPATPWLLTHENAKVRAWAMLMYLPAHRKKSPPSEGAPDAGCGPQWER